MSTKRDERPDTWTDAERAAMQERARELKAASRRGSKSKVDGEQDLLSKVAEMPEPDRSIATRIHALIKEHAPELQPKTWYGMPAYARDGKVLCFFQSATKFESRYATLGFNDPARLDDGAMWATAFAVTDLTAEAEARIVALIRRALS